MLKTISENWLKEFKKELKGTNTLFIVSPFITDVVVQHLLENFKGKDIKVITRYNLNDFRKGVSSLSAIKELHKAKAKIKSVKNLHSKLYIFDSKSVIITSANFTTGGFFNNKEFGILCNSESVIEESIQYFNDLWNVDPSVLTLKRIISWSKEIDSNKPDNNVVDTLPDYGISQKKVLIKGRRYFVKFFGSSKFREPLTYAVRTEIANGCSHYALSFSMSKNDARPVRYRDGDIVFMAKMTNTYDYAVFAKASVLAHDRIKDISTSEDIKHIDWLEDYPILVRVENPIFIDSTLANCPKLNNLMSELKHESFHSTKHNFKQGVRIINPKGTLMRKADVILSDEGALWMDKEFNNAIEKLGKVPKQFISKFYNGTSM